MSEALVRRIPWAAISSLLLAAVLVGLVATHETPADTAQQVGSLIRCPVCQGVPISESPSPMAQDMMAILTERLEAGATREEAIDSLLSAYPGSLLLETPVSGSTLPLWLVPLAALVVGVGLATTIRRSRAGHQAPAERAELEQRQEAIRADLDDLASQSAGGEIDPEMASHLRRAYTAELAEAREALASASPTQGTHLPRSRRRVMAGIGAIVGSLVVIVVVAGIFITERPDTASGVAGVGGDPSQYSNETLAAVIAENQDHPMIDGMRLALAERYFEAGEYSEAFPYFLEIVESENATDVQAATALTRLGWMAYDGNGEAATAMDLLQEAARIVPTDPFPVYLQGIVSWCGLGQPDVAVAAFQQVLDSPDLDEAIRSRIEEDLDTLSSGGSCDT